ncbi:MAG: hypothetical protein JNK05_25630 [Myxococcales bacterium]|nr:hypothetical protein [Myxococcales bacterium]
MSTVAVAIVASTIAAPFAVTAMIKSELLDDRRARAATVIVTLKCVIVASLALLLGD